MDIYLKTVGVVLSGLLLCLILSKNAKDYSVLIAILLCCAVAAAAASIVQPIIQTLNAFDTLFQSNASHFSLLIKTVGIAFIGETVAAICSDSGHVAVGKTLELLTTVTILWIALPLINSLLKLIQSILEMI